MLGCAAVVAIAAAAFLVGRYAEDHAVKMAAPSSSGQAASDAVDSLAEVDRAWQKRDREVAAIDAPAGVEVRREWIAD